MMVSATVGFLKVTVEVKPRRPSIAHDPSTTSPGSALWMVAVQLTVVGVMVTGTGETPLAFR